MLRFNHLWGYSSAGRASGSQSEGHRFKSGYLHFFCFFDCVNTLYYYKVMKIEWNEEKNELLKETRNVSFEEVLEEISKGSFIGPEENPARKEQNE